MIRADVNQAAAYRLALPNGLAEVDPVSGGLAALRLTDPDTSFIGRPAKAGLLRLALPRPHHPSHYVEVGTHGRPEIEALAAGPAEGSGGAGEWPALKTEEGQRAGSLGGLRLRYGALATVEGPIAVEVEIDLAAAEDGLRLRARVSNTGTDTIPQVLFPQLLGLAAIDGAGATRLQLGRGQMRPLREITARPDDARYLQINLQRYIPYGKGAHSMKWCDYGSSRRGFSLYARDTRDTTQGLLVDRPDRAEERLDLQWVHYPFIRPGETWESGEYVLLPHAGDWYAGARAYQQFTQEQYPYHAPRRLREALGVRTIWAAVRSTPPAFPLSAIAEYAAEIADPELGLAELVVWHWWLKNGYPIFLDPRLGTEEQFRAVLDRCRELGVPVSLFVSHHLVRDTDETDPSWEFRNAAGQRVLSNWTYGPGFAPRFGPSFIGTHSMVRGTALSPGWRATGLAEYRTIQEKYGPVSICFDVFGAWSEPDFNPAADGRPDEEGEKLLEFARQARALIHGADPEATFSGEHITDTRVPVLDYTWEWRNGFDMEASAPFRYVFPQYRLNANVNEHPRGALLAFMEGALLNVMPGNMHSFRLRDCPELVAMLRQLAALRRRFLRYFVEGQFRFTEGLQVTGAVGRVYTQGADTLVIVANPSDAPAEVTFRLDPGAWGAALGPAAITTYGLDGSASDRTRHAGGVLEWSRLLGADDLYLVEVAG